MKSQISNKQIINFFSVSKPKRSTTEVNFRIAIGLALCFPIIKLTFSSNLLSLIIWLVIILISYISYGLPRFIKNKRYVNRISQNVFNCFFLDAFKNKIITKAVNYMNIDIEDISKKDIIIIPYPVFNNTKKIDDKQLYRVPCDTNETNEYFNYSYWNVQILILNKNSINFYFCSYNLLNGKIINERSSEFLYKNIVAAELESLKVKILSKWIDNNVNEILILKIIHDSGTTLKVLTQIPELKQAPYTIVDSKKMLQKIRNTISQANANEKNKRNANLEFIKEMQTSNYQTEKAST